MSKRILNLLGSVLLSAFAGCTQSPATIGPNPTPPAQTQTPSNGGTSGSQAVQPVNASSSVPTYTVDVKNTFPHATGAFTEGILFLDGSLYESTGVKGQSSLRKVELKTGKVLQKISVPPQYFGEGMTIFQSKVYQLTWQEQKCFVYDPKTFQKKGEFSYTGEGWGLTHDDKQLIMSDGTNRIRFIDPTNFQVKRTIAVLNPMDGKPLNQLNELEYIKGEIYANVWTTDVIVRIDPQSGKVVGMIDLADLYPQSQRVPGPGAKPPDVLNGIAYDADKDRLFVTGKYWPKLYEIALKKQ